MADDIRSVTSPAGFCFERDRVTALLKTLEAMAAGQVDERLAISTHHDELDAIAHGVNVLVGELGWLGARAKEAQEQKAVELHAVAARAEARSEAILKAVPDLMFVLLRDGTFVDYQARDAKLLFVPPGRFLGRKVRDVMPPAIADMMMNALDRACRGEDQIVVEYELSLDQPRSFEARIVQAGADRLLVIVRDITQAKRASELIHDLAGRLIALQETERQRIARDLHDDINQRLTILSFEIYQIAAQADPQLQTCLGKLAERVAEIGGAVHDISYALHPARLQIMPLIPAVRSLCDDASKLYDLRVAFTPGVIPESVDANVTLCVYRIVQEALHNIARHSGAREAEVSVTCDEAHVTLRIADSGVGFDTKRLSQGKLGLLSMQERVAFLKGQLAIDAVPGRGTRITVRIPLISEGGYSPAAFVAST